MTSPNLPETSLYIAQMPDIYIRNMIYDPSWGDPSYGEYEGTRIVPAKGSIVQDTNYGQLWVINVDPVTHVPTYMPVPQVNDNDSVTSMLNYGNALLRLYVDKRAMPYRVVVDSKCRFIGKSPRYYRLTRYPGTSNASVISQYFDVSGTLVSTQVALAALDSSNTSWYLPPAHISVDVDENEEILMEIFDESGQEVFSARLFARESVVVNEDVTYLNPIASINVRANQVLPNGDFFVREKQDVTSLAITVELVYTDGSTLEVPVDNMKCFLYGVNDFIPSYAGLVQPMMVKYFRSNNEAIQPGAGDATGEMISKTFNVVVIPNELGVTTKIVPVPYYSTTTSRYIVGYYMYFADGRASINVGGYVSVINSTLVTDASKFGVWQNYTASVNMKDIDPINYPVDTIRTQNIRIQFGPPGTYVKWMFMDSELSPYVYGVDSANNRRPVIKYDSALGKYFIPTPTFGNTAAFINSFYRQASPFFDPNVTQVPQDPTHFLVRDINSGVMITADLIPIDSYGAAFNIIESLAGAHNNATVLVEFVNVVSSTERLVLYGAPVNTVSGTYVS